MQKEKRLVLKSVIAANSGLNIFLQLANFVQYLRYLSGASDVNSISLLAAGVKLRYADDPDTVSDTFQFR